MAREGLLIGSPKSGEEVGNVPHPQEKEKKKKKHSSNNYYNFPCNFEVLLFLFL